MAEEAVAGGRETGTALPERRGTLGAILLARLSLNAPMRIVYPFLPAISRGLGLPLETTTLLLTARGLVSMASPLLGLLADRTGRRGLMLLGLVALIAGALLVSAEPAFAPALVAFALMGLGKAGYDPAMQAFVSDAVPYERRGRVLAILELSWSLSWLIGVPAAGFLISAAGWQAPFLAIALVGLASLALMAIVIPRGAADRAGPRRAFELQSSRGVPSVPGELRALGWAALLALVVSLLMTLAIENVLIVYGVWMESRFGLSVTALGLASTAIAVAEFAAECASAGLVDRIGKHRAVLGGLVLNLLAYLLLPRIAKGLPGAVAGTSLLFLAFEFSIVSILPLISELAPEARATVMALNVAATSLGRVIASLSAPRLWAAGGLVFNTRFSAGAVLLAILLLGLATRKTMAPPVAARAARS